jgi:hypothetical protein
MNLMLDIETLGSAPDSVILTIAACAFDPFSDAIYDQHALYSRIDTECQNDRSIDESTVAWWANQSAAAQEEAFGEQNRVPLEDALQELSDLIWKSNITWANGISFDVTILENAFKSYGMQLPWQYYNVLDARTVYRMNPDRERLGNSHHAFEDVILQIGLLQRTFKKLGIKSL